MEPARTDHDIFEALGCRVGKGDAKPVNVLLDCRDGIAVDGPDASAERFIDDPEEIAAED